MNLVLKVTSGPHGLGEKFPLLPNRAIIVGRETEGDATFAADELMSWNHFSLAMTTQGCFLTDLASANGTLVNGARVVHCQVYPGDQIQAGRTVFQVEQESAQSVDTSTVQAPVQTLQPAEARQASLTIASKSGSKRILFQGQRITIGRTAISEWVFPDDPRMSSEHMAIQSTGQSWQVVDLGSSNGTQVNGKRTNQANLESGDTIVAGSTEFSIVIVVENRIAEYKAPMPSAPILFPKAVPNSETIAPSHESKLSRGAIESSPTQPFAVEKPPLFRVTIQCLTDPNLSADYEQGQTLVIGRSTDADISVPHDFMMSSSHVRIRILEKQVELLDLDSTNGTDVNGNRVQKVTLNHGDQFLLGKHTFCIGFAGQESIAAPSSHQPIPHPPQTTPPRELLASSEPIISKKVTSSSPRSSRSPLIIEADASLAESDIPFESFPCGSGLYFYSGCVPAFDPIDIARRLTLATPGWLLKQNDFASRGSKENDFSKIHIERLSPIDPSWMIPWSQSWGQEKSLVVYSRSDESKILTTFQMLFETLHATNQKFPSHPTLIDFLTNRLSDTVNRVFAPLDAILVELYSGKQWAYVASRDLESVLPQLRFRKKYRW